MLSWTLCMAGEQWISGFVRPQKTMVSQYQPRAMIFILTWHYLIIVISRCLIGKKCRSWICQFKFIEATKIPITVLLRKTAKWSDFYYKLGFEALSHTCQVRVRLFADMIDWQGWLQIWSLSSIADPGEAKHCSTNTSDINWLTN